MGCLRSWEALRGLVQTWAFCPGPPKPSLPPENSHPSGSLKMLDFLSYSIGSLQALGLISHPTGSPEDLGLFPTPLGSTSSCSSPYHHSLTFCRPFRSCGDCVGEEEQTASTPDIPRPHGFVLEARTIFEGPQWIPPFSFSSVLAHIKLRQWCCLVMSPLKNSPCPLVKYPKICYYFGHFIYFIWINFGCYGYLWGISYIPCLFRCHDADLWCKRFVTL